MTAAGAGRKATRSPFATVRRTAKDWLDRPMTSWHLIVAIFFLLLGFGLLMVLSASSIASYRANDGAPFATFENQAIFAVIGMFGFLFASRVSTRMLRTFSFPLVAVTLLLLAAVLAVGKKTGGARSWIDLGPIQFQPSEIAKLALLIWMGHVLASRRHTLRSIRSLLIPVLPVFVIMVALIMREPDLGTTVSLGLVFIAALWFGGAPWWMFAGLTASAAAAMVYLATSANYRTDRVAAWLHPGSVDAGSIYQITQSYYGLGHGGIFGAGLGQSVAKTGWLPNADSDFIFAVIGEELGLIGAGLVVLLFGLLAYTGLRIARRNVDPFVKIVASAATVWLVGQAAINIGYVVGLLPVTGIPLPMISRGGTSLVISMVVFGLLANFARREPQAAAALHSQGPGRVARFLGIGFKPPKPSKAPKVRPAKAAATRDGAPGRSQPRPDRRPVAAPASRIDPHRREPGSPQAGRRYSPKSSGAVSAAPTLRRSGDGRPAGRPGTDWQGRGFTEPVAHRGRENSVRPAADGRRQVDARREFDARPEVQTRRDVDARRKGAVRGRGRSTGRGDGSTGQGRTVRP